MKLHSRSLLYAILLVSLGWLVSSCGSPIPTRVEASPTAAIYPTPTVPLPPTEDSTPTPELPMAVLLASPSADQAWVDSLQAALNDIVTASGLRWEVRPNLSKADLTPALRLVVAIPPDPGLSSLVADAPSTQFLALDIPGVQPRPNLTLIHTSPQPDQQGFLAGAIAAMLAPDWRAGAISLSDTVEGRSARTGFLNGVLYFCGLCRPAHPPFYEYPLYIELPSTASAAEWDEAANYMVDHFVQTVYVYPGAGDSSMLAILADAGVNIISGGEPPESTSSSWVLSLDTDPISLVQSQAKGLLDSTLSGGESFTVLIQFTHINQSILTPGKQRLAGEVLSNLQTGYIDTGVDLTTGENRP